MRLFIFGAGYSGKAIAREMSGKAEWIGGTTRTQEGQRALSKAGVEPFAFDGGGLSMAAAAALRKTTHLILSIAPGEAGDPVLWAGRRIVEREMPALRWIGYLSTVGVYGDHGGAWVDEDTPCRPAGGRSMRRLAAEQDWREAAASAGRPLSILRLPGIYGPGRNAFVNLASGAARRIVKHGQVFNRVHVDDIAGAASFLAVREAGGVFNVTDDEPAPPQDVVEYAAGLMGVEPPPAVAFEQADLSPMGRSFYGENKKVSNAKIRGLGYKFRHATYREGLDALWLSGAWRVR